LGGTAASSKLAALPRFSTLTSLPFSAQTAHTSPAAQSRKITLFACAIHTYAALNDLILITCPISYLGICFVISQIAAHRLLLLLALQPPKVSRNAREVIGPRLCALNRADRSYLDLSLDLSLTSFGRA
jgi:hypothetical protein